MHHINSRYLDKKGLAAALALTAAAMFLPDHASAQTVQCASAAEPAELEICNNEDLMVLDEQMSRLNAVREVAFNNRPKFENFSKSTQLWIKKRNSCGLNADCIKLHYYERIIELSERPTLLAL